MGNKEQSYECPASSKLFKLYQYRSSPGCKSRGNNGDKIRGLEIMKKEYILAGIVIIAVLLVAGAYYFNQKQPEPEFTEARENVTICYFTTISGLITIANEQGFFSEHGLDATLKKYPIGTKTAFESMFEEECDIATVSETFIATTNREDFSIFTTIGTSDSNTKIIARRDSGIQKPADLKGKRIATRKGSSSHFFLHAFILKNGISENDVTILFKNSEELPPGLANGDFDAFSMAEPYIGRTKKLLGDNGVIFTEPGLSITTFNLVAMNSFIKDRPFVIDRILLGLIQAEEYARNYPNETIKILSKQFGLDESEISDILGDTKLEVSLDQSLLLEMEDETRWAINTNQSNRTNVPNYLDYIFPDNLERIKPKAVTIIN
jgi:NitT/TauT family transport system substrate-binding protein